MICILPQRLERPLPLAVLRETSDMHPFSAMYFITSLPDALAWATYERETGMYMMERLMTFEYPHSVWLVSTVFSVLSVFSGGGVIDVSKQSVRYLSMN
jgi:hypothetical protein